MASPAPPLVPAPWLLRLARVALLVGLAWAVHEQARWLTAQQPSPFSLRQARRFFPAAHRIQLRDPERGLHFVTDTRGETIGCLLSTAPHTDSIIGYAGPNDVLLALDPGGRLIGVELLRSGDTAEHVRQVRTDARFLHGFLGWRPGEEPFPKVEAVSGATLTSLAIAEGIQQRLAGAAPSLRFPEPITLEQVRQIIPGAARLVPESARWRVLGASSELLGYALRTSPQADNVSGYRGPTDCLVALARDGRTITAVQMGKSYDTDAYVDQIRKATQFLSQFIGRRLEDLAVYEFPKEKPDGVSGATLTARAVGEGLKRRFIVELKERQSPAAWRPRPRDWGLAAVVAGAGVMSFTRWRGSRPARLAWQLLVVGYLGLVNHDLLSLALFGGWMSHGIALASVPALALLTGAALLVPWATGHQLYCHHLCAHGAAQQLLGMILRGRLRWAVPPRVGRALERVPVVLLGVALVLTVCGRAAVLVNLEPFDAWVWRTAGTATLVLAGVGLALSLFIPQAYCRFGCPTGAVLAFVRTRGSADRWGRRDWAAAGLLGVTLTVMAGLRAWPKGEEAPEPLTLSGRTMGTTWSVKLHDEVADAGGLEREVDGRFEWAESMTSHWRSNTDLSIFNRTLSTDPLPLPWPVITLARWGAEISRQTDGAYDITVGPLVRLWGFGPGPRRTTPPDEAEIAAARPAVGWRQLDILDGQLRKQNPGLAVDLSSIAKGWAVDQVVQFLERRGYTNFLVEAGGELRARGRWSVAIEHPMRRQRLDDQALATSGTYRQNFKSGGRQFSHLIDPRTGRPITHATVSVSVLHPDCAHADAWATAMNVIGRESGLPLADQLGLAVQFVTEQADGKLEVTSSKSWPGDESKSTPPSNPARKGYR